MDKVPVTSSPPRSKDQVLDKMIHVTELFERKEKELENRLEAAEAKMIQ